MSKPYSFITTPANRISLALKKAYPERHTRDYLELMAATVGIYRYRDARLTFIDDMWRAEAVIVDLKTLLDRVNNFKDAPADPLSFIKIFLVQWQHTLKQLRAPEQAPRLYTSFKQYLKDKLRQQPPIHQPMDLELTGPAELACGDGWIWEPVWREAEELSPGPLVCDDGHREPVLYRKVPFAARWHSEDRLQPEAVTSNKVRDSLYVVCTVHGPRGVTFKGVMTPWLRDLITHPLSDEMTDILKASLETLTMTHHCTFHSTSLAAGTHRGHPLCQACLDEPDALVDLEAKISQENAARWGFSDAVCEHVWRAYQVRPIDIDDWPEEALCYARALRDAEIRDA